jgi:hypothetical protein
LYQSGSSTSAIATMAALSSATEARLFMRSMALF